MAWHPDERGSGNVARRLGPPGDRHVRGVAGSSVQREAGGLGKNQSDVFCSGILGAAGLAAASLPRAFAIGGNSAGRRMAATASAPQTAPSANRAGATQALTCRNQTGSQRIEEFVNCGKQECRPNSSTVVSSIRPAQSQLSFPRLTTQEPWPNCGPSFRSRGSLPAAWVRSDVHLNGHIHQLRSAVGNDPFQAAADVLHPPRLTLHGQ